MSNDQSEASEADGGAGVAAMLNDAGIRHVLALARSDPRPWPRVIDEAVVARVFFQTTFRELREPPEDMRLLEEAARDLGFSTSREEHIGLSADLLAWLVVVVSVPIAANNLLKAANELPENFHKLRAKLRGHPKALLSAGLQLEPVNRWLDSIYGAKQWRYDPEAVTASVIAEVVLYDLTEEISGTAHRLLVRGDSVIDVTDRK